MDIRDTSIDHVDRSGRKTLGALFRDCDAAEAAIRDLQEAGVSKEDIGMVTRQRTDEGALVEDEGSLAVDGLASGVVGGGVLGGVLGLLVGLGSLMIPGVGPVVAAGVLGTTLAGASIGAVSGGLVGALVGLGIPESEASYFEQGVKDGGVVVVANALGRDAQVREAFLRHGGELGPYDIDEGIRLVDEGRSRGDGPRMI